MVYVMNAGPAGRVGIPGEKGIMGPVGDTGVTGAASSLYKFRTLDDGLPGMYTVQYIITFFFP